MVELLAVNNPNSIVQISQILHDSTFVHLHVQMYIAFAAQLSPVVI